MHQQHRRAAVAFTGKQHVQFNAVDLHPFQRRIHGFHLLFNRDGLAPDRRAWRAVGGVMSGHAMLLSSRQNVQ